MDVSGPPPPNASGAPAPDLEDLYDEGVLALIDHGAVAGPPPGAMSAAATQVPPVEPGAVAAEPLLIPRYPVARRFGITGAMLAGAMMGVAEVLEPERARQHIIEHVPDRLDEDGQLVTYHHVPGDPRASRIVVRPWLRERFRRVRADARRGPGTGD
jgi:hypothetical protein